MQIDRLSRILASRRSVLAGLAGLGLTLVGGRGTEAHTPVPACRQIKNATKRRACLQRARRHNRQHQQTQQTQQAQYEVVTLSGAALCLPEFDVDDDPQTCNNPMGPWDSANNAWGRSEPTPLAIKLRSPATHCSDVSYIVTWEDQDAVHSLVTGFMQPGEERDWQQLGSADDRVRWFTIDAAGRPGGCNEGRLEAFEVAFDLRMPRQA